MWSRLCTQTSTETIGALAENIRRVIAYIGPNCCKKWSEIGFLKFSLIEFNWASHVGHLSL